VQAAGLIIESDGPALSLGEVCEIRSPGMAHLDREVVGPQFASPAHAFWRGAPRLPGSESRGLRTGVARSGREGLMGEILSMAGPPIDGRARSMLEMRGLRSDPPNPLRRQRITAPFQTGIKGIDLFTPMGCGQRMGIFRGSGVGKSTSSA